MQFMFWLFTIVCTKFISVTGTCNADEQSKSVRQLIEEKILCNYDKDVRPNSKDNTTEITFHFQPVSIEYIDNSACMKLTTWINLFWKDENINWDVTQYKNLEYINVGPNKLWSPDIMLFNWVDESVSIENLVSTFATHEGIVYGISKVILKGHCVPDYTRWPFDEHVCEFVLLSKQYFGHEVDFTLFSKKGMYLTYFVPNPEWEMLEYSARRNETQYGKVNSKDYYAVAITLSFKIRRQASVQVATFVLPALAILVLSLAVFWLDPTNSQRLLLISVLAVLQCLYLEYLAFKINSNGDTIPRIVRFYSGSLVITVVLFLMTVLTRCMMKWSSRPPWLQSLSNLILLNRTIQFIFLLDSDPKTAAAFVESGEEEGLTLVTKSEGGQQWRMLAEIIHKIAFIIIFPVYTFLLLHFLV